MPDMRPLNARQLDSLYVVRDNGPVTPRELSNHLLMENSTARSVLTSLENRKLVDATYTQTRLGRTGRAYVVSERGEEVLAAKDAASDAEWDDQRA